MLLTDFASRTPNLPLRIVPVTSSLHLNLTPDVTSRMSTFRVTLKVVGDGVDPVAIGFVRVPLDASLAVNIDTLLLNTCFWPQRRTLHGSP